MYDAKGICMFTVAAKGHAGTIGSKQTPWPDALCIWLRFAKAYQTGIYIIQTNLSPSLLHEYSLLNAVQLNTLRQRAPQTHATSAPVAAVNSTTLDRRNFLLGLLAVADIVQLSKMQANAESSAIETVSCLICYLMGDTACWCLILFLPS